MVILPSNSQIVLDYKYVIFCVLLFVVASSHIINFKLHVTNLGVLISGSYYQNILPKTYNQSIENEFVRRNPHFKISSGVTPENIRITGAAVDGIRKALNMQKISFMVPDVGGLGLCCSQIEVIDSALLTNKNLARHGYKIFDEYLSLQSPDVIETHGVWSEISRIYDSSYFQVNYLPIVFNNNLLWIRSDIYTELSSSSSLAVINLSLSQDFGMVRHSYDGIDMSYLKARQYSTIRSYQSL